MNMYLHHCRVFALMAIVVLAHAVTMELAPGSIVTMEKTIDNAWIESETTDGVKFFLGDVKSDKKVESTRKPGQYQKVIYTGNGEDLNFMKADTLYGKVNFDESIEHYKNATVSARYHWVVEQAYRRAAECLAHSANKNEAVLSLLKEYVTRYPKNIHMAEVVLLRARLGLAAGDFAGATKDYQEMAKKGAVWSPTAELDGMIGQRNVLIAQKKFTESVAVLTPYLATLKPDENPDAFGKVALAMASDLAAEGKDAEFIATLKRIYLAPISSEAQARARLQYARFLAKGKTTESAIAAFDQAAIAGLLGGDDETRTGAAKLAHELVTRIQSDKTISDEVRKEYRTYASQF